MEGGGGEGIRDKNMDREFVGDGVHPGLTLPANDERGRGRKEGKRGRKPKKQRIAASWKEHAHYVVQRSSETKH